MRSTALTVALVVGCLMPGSLTAQDENPDSERIERIETALEILVQPAPRPAALSEARLDLQQAGAAGLARLLEQLPKVQGAVRARLEQVFLDGVGLLRVDLAKAEKEDRERLRSSILELGYPVALSLARGLELSAEGDIPGWSLDALGHGVPTGREGPECAALFSELVRQAEAALGAGKQPDLSAGGRLVAPLLAMLLRDEAPTKVQRHAEGVRQALVNGFLLQLQGDGVGLREHARESLYTFGELALPELEEAAGREGPQADLRYWARRLSHRIHYRLPEEVFSRTGILLDGFAEKPWRERRGLCYELEIAAGNVAIPCLRRILSHDPEPRVKIQAATSLARLGDPFGVMTLERAGLLAQMPSKEITIAVYMDQGLQYLRLERYPQAIEQFEKVLELDPENDIAWYNLACAHSLSGALDEAVAALEKSIGFGFDDLEHMEADSDLDNIRQTEGYRKLVEQLEQAPQEEEEETEDR